MLASGHRVKARVGHHQITIHAAGIVLGAGAAAFMSYFDLCRRRRNVISYEGDEIGQEQAVELLEEVRRFSGLVDRWLQANYPELVS